MNDEKQDEELNVQSGKASAVIAMFIYANISIPKIG